MPAANDGQGGEQIYDEQFIVDYLWHVKQSYATLSDMMLDRCVTCAANEVTYDRVVSENIGIINQLLEYQGPLLSWRQPDGSIKQSQAVEAYVDREPTGLRSIGFYAIDTSVPRRPNTQVAGEQVPLELIESLTPLRIPERRV